MLDFHQEWRAVCQHVQCQIFRIPSTIGDKAPNSSVYGPQAHYHQLSDPWLTQQLLNPFYVGHRDYRVCVIEHFEVIF